MHIVVTSVINILRTYLKKKTLKKTKKHNFLQLNLGFILGNFVFKEDGFNVISRFRKIMCSQERDSIQVSQKFCAHQIILYGF